MENLTPHGSPEILVPAVRVAERIGVTRRTLSRWLSDPGLKFPQPISINGRLYVWEVELNAWLAERARLSVSKAA